MKNIHLTVTIIINTINKIESLRVKKVKLQLPAGVFIFFTAKQCDRLGGV